MSNTYRFISWTPFKKKYDQLMVALIVIYVGLYGGILVSQNSNIQPQLLLIKTTGSLAIFMIHVILAMGPLARISNIFLPLLYNRRHLGVSMFLVVTFHAVLSMLYYHGFGVIGPFASLFRGSNSYIQYVGFPFMVLGFAAWVLLLYMAITSHDYWLNRIGPKMWKYLHMMVYLAYILIIGHVCTGALLRDVSMGVYGVYYLGVASIVSLHLYAAFKDWSIAKLRTKAVQKGLVLVGDVRAIPSDRAQVVEYKGESIAVFRYDDKLSAIANKCKHQGGPLGEGVVLDGCVTCPWHGYQYLPHNGQSPPPFTEKIATYRLSIIGGLLYVDPQGEEEGTPVEPLTIPAIAASGTAEFFVGWAAKLPPALRRPLLRVSGFLLILVCVVAIVMSVGSHSLKDSTFVYGDVKEYTGTLHLYPVPRLSIKGKDFLLVDFGKHSALRSIKTYQAEHDVSLEYQAVTIQGTEIAYHDHHLLELSAKSLSIKSHQLSGSSIDDQEQVETDFVIAGEVLDAKCFFGVMNPGSGTVHKFCAALCIQGGIPAVVFDDASDDYYIIRGSNGEDINATLVELAGEKVRLSGSVHRYNNWKYIYLTEPADQLTFRSILGESVPNLCAASSVVVD